MDFINDYYLMQERIAENKTWKLLRADNAEIVLSFLKNVFKEEREIPYDEAYVLLTGFLNSLSKEKIDLKEGNNAAYYLRSWMNSGWLLEMNNKLFMTDSAQKALSFTSTLDNEVISTSETNLAILLTEVQNLFIGINTDTKAKTKELRQNIKKLEAQVKMINSGQDTGLSEHQKREKIRNIYDMANRLPLDFRKLEEEIRDADILIRQNIIKNKNTKGKILKEALEQEQEQRRTAYGEAFEGFFKLLCDDEKQERFKKQLSFILNSEASKYLGVGQCDFLRNLTSVLIKSCDRIHRIRATIDKNLELYINSTDLDLSQNISILLEKIEKTAIKLKEQKFSLAAKHINFELKSGKVKAYSPISSNDIQLPYERAEIDEYKHHQSTNVVSSHLLQKLDTVKLKVVRNNIFAALKNKESCTVADIIKNNNIEYGLEEVVAYIRIAQELKAERVDEIEELEIQDHKHNKTLRIRIPKQTITTNLVENYLKDSIK